MYHLELYSQFFSRNLCGKVVSISRTFLKWNIISLTLLAVFYWPSFCHFDPHSSQKTIVSQKKHDVLDMKICHKPTYNFSGYPSPSKPCRGWYLVAKCRRDERDRPDEENSRPRSKHASTPSRRQSLVITVLHMYFFFRLTLHCLDTKLYMLDQLFS